MRIVSQTVVCGSLPVDNIYEYFYLVSLSNFFDRIIIVTSKLYVIILLYLFEWDMKIITFFSMESLENTGIQYCM